jgi:hypothetical protein
LYFFKILFVTWCKGTATIYYFFGHLTSAITSGVEQINSKLIVYIRDFKSSKKFELLPPEVTLAENWFKSTGSPLFIFAKLLDNKGIAEKIEFTLWVRTLPFDLS